MKNTGSSGRTSVPRSFGAKGGGKGSESSRLREQEYAASLARAKAEKEAREWRRGHEPEARTKGNEFFDARTRGICIEGALFANPTFLVMCKKKKCVLPSVTLQKNKEYNQ